MRAPTVSKNYSLKEGEKITIKINTTRKSKATAGDDGGDDQFGSGFGGKASTTTGSGGDSDLLGFGNSSTYVLNDRLPFEWTVPMLTAAVNLTSTVKLRPATGRRSESKASDAEFRNKQRR